MIGNGAFYFLLLYYNKSGWCLYADKSFASVLLPVCLCALVRVFVCVCALTPPLTKLSLPPRSPRDSGWLIFIISHSSTTHWMHFPHECN